MKRIAVFIDGTWNRPDAAHPTNVLRLARCVMHHDRDKDIAQRVIYLPGVGSNNGNNWLGRKLDRVFGGALGWGLMEIVEEAYRNLVFTYEPGDEVYLFGFSRGAFAARSLAGLIRSSGICPPRHMHRVPEAVKRYVSRDPETEPKTLDSQIWREDFAPYTATSEDDYNSRRARKPESQPIWLQINYVGVWDTVKALGIPASLPGSSWINETYSFHDDKLSSSVLAARHAVAIDERRRTFRPTLWDNLDRLNGDDIDTAPAFLQQFFPGNHGSVGGGGRRDLLSSIPLNWIAMGAEDAGLKLSWEHLDREIMNGMDPVNGPLENKFGPVGVFGFLNLPKEDREGPKELENLSVAALDRMVAKDGYRPPTLNFVRDDIDKRPQSQMAALRDWLVARDGGPTHAVGSKIRPRDWEPPKDAFQRFPPSNGFPPEDDD